ncbi:MAG: hypothetical protein ACREHV_06095 [Rhizomicrobium sp.]
MLPHVRNERLIVALAGIVGLALIAISIVYFSVAAGSLPSFFPGHAAGSSAIHVKHGIAALLVGLACLVLVWFLTGPKRRPSAG